MWSFVKPAALAMVVAGAHASALRNRFLSETKIAGYEPTHDVTDELRIDLDQKAIQDYLDGAVASGFGSAKNVYEKGAFSGSVSTITLKQALGFAMKKHDRSTGRSTEDKEIVLIATEDYSASDTVIQLRYLNGDCNVGGLPSDEDEGAGDQIWVGCLKSEGELTSDGASAPLAYSYDVSTSSNLRTIQSFSSKDAQGRTDVETLQRFIDYYGSTEYADQWITAAFDGTKTDFVNGNGDFTSYDYEARAQAVMKGTAYMNLWMKVILALEDAVKNCKVDFLDEAVAFYTGSTEGTEGTEGEGYLPYAVAQKRSANCKTGGPNGDSVEGTAKVNIDVFQQFNLMKDNLQNGKCAESRSNVDRVVQLMTVPLVQASIRYAHILAYDADAEVSDQCERAAFAATVLPLVYQCSPQDAAVIYDNMRTGQPVTSFVDVKSAFERNYACLGITCADVGGLYDSGLGEYQQDASPCGGAGGTTSSSVNVGLAVGLSVAAAVAILLVFLWCRYSRKTPQVETKSGGDESAMT